MEYIQKEVFNEETKVRVKFKNFFFSPFPLLFHLGMFIVLSQEVVGLKPVNKKIKTSNFLTIITTGHRAIPEFLKNRNNNHQRIKMSS